MSQNTQIGLEGMASNSEEAKQMYTKILRENGITTEIKEVIIVEPESLKGEHMPASSCQYVTIKFADDSKDLELFIKILLKNPFADIMTNLEVFDKEAVFFNDLLPKAKQFCIAKTGTDDLINFLPKCYFANESLIIQENLILQDYFSMLGRTGRQNLPQAKMVLKNLAKFHGVFYATINDMGVQTFLTKYPVAVKEVYLGEAARPSFAAVFENNVNHAIRVLEVSKLEGSEEVVEWLKKQLGNLYDKACNILVTDPNEKFVVFNHGDCWNNNFMFLKNKETGELIHHIFVDLQLTRYTSPNIDIGYFLFTSVKPEVRRKHLKNLLKFYFDTLEETVKKLGTSVPVSFDEFEDDYKKKCTFGFWIGMVFFYLLEDTKNLDLGKGGDGVEQVKEIQKWFEDNPEKAKNSCKEVIESVQEYAKMFTS